MVLWYYGTMVLWYYGTMVLWYYGTMVLWYYGTMVLWYYGTMQLVKRRRKRKHVAWRKTKSSVPCACGASLQPTLPMTEFGSKHVQFKAQILEMLRTVASPGTFGYHDRRFFCKCTEVTDNSCARLPGVNISEVPNSAVGQPRNSYIPPT